MSPPEIFILVFLVGGLAFVAGARAASMSSEAMTEELVRRAVERKMRNVTAAAIDAEIEQTACALVRSIK